MNIADGAAFETVILERFKLILLNTVSEETAKYFAIPCEVDISVFEDWVQNSLTIRLKQEIMGRIADEVEAVYPSDWWQAFKERWFPGWAKKKWPVRKTMIKLTARELYPEVAMPERKHYINLTKWVGHYTKGENEYT